MLRSRFSIAALLVAAALVACSPPQTATIPTTSISGTVLAPAGVIGAGAGNVIGAGAGNVIGAGAGNVIGAGAGNLLGPAIPRRLLALNEQPVAGNDVYLANAAGTPYLNLPHGTTDAQGNYQIPDVPVGYPFVVATKVQTASGTATLQTLTKSDATLQTPANVDAASTLVTNSVVTGSGALGDFNPATFQRAAAATAQALTPSTLPDLTNPQAMAAYMTQLAAQVSDIQSELGQLKTELATLQGSVDDLNQKLGQLAQQDQSRTGTAASTPPNAPLSPIMPQPMPTGAAPQAPAITPVPIVPSPRPRNLPITISGHLVQNGTAFDPVSNIQLDFSFQSPGASPEASATTQSDGSFSVPLHYNTGAAIQFWVYTIASDNGTAGLGWLTINPDGSAQFQLTDTTWTPSYSITIP